MRVNIRKLNQKDPEERIVKEAARLLQQGDVILHPTETVYGLAVKWDSHPGLIRLADIKKRSLEQPLSLLINQIEQIPEICGWQSKSQATLLNALFPGPVTILLERCRELPLDYWNQFTHVGFRLPSHSLSRMLTQFSKAPIVTTSANVSGDSAARDFPEVNQQIIEQVAMAINGGSCQHKIASTILKPNFKTGDFKILRHGAMSEKIIAMIFKSTFHQ